MLVGNEWGPGSGVEMRLGGIALTGALTSVLDGAYLSEGLYGGAWVVCWGAGDAPVGPRLRNPRGQSAIATSASVQVYHEAFCECSSVSPSSESNGSRG